MSDADGLVAVVSVSSFGVGDPAPLHLLSEHGVRVVPNPFGRTLREDEIADLIVDADGVIAGTEPLTEQVLRQARRLKVISRVGAGLDNVDLAAAERLGIAVYSTPDAVTDAAAELTLAGILAVLRHLHWMDAELRAGRWSRRMGGLLRGRTVGVVGLGRVGRRVAELLRPFGVALLGTDVAPDRTWATEHGVELTTLADLLPAADVVTLHASGSARILGAAELARMKPGAVLANTARGVLVDEEALLQALRDDRLAGAYLDTFATEPYSGPLCTLPNVVVTPHAGSYAREARVRMEREAAEQLLRALAETAP